MKEAYIIYVVGKEEIDQEKLNEFLCSHNFDNCLCRLCGRQPLSSLEQAYLELQHQGVMQIDCLAVAFDRKAGNYFFLEQQLMVDGQTDIAQFCRPEEFRRNLRVEV